MSDDIREVVENIEARAEKFGLYLRGVQMAAASSSDEDNDEAMKEMPGADELKDKLKSGDLNVILFTVFSVRELAFSDRIQNPIKVRDEDEFSAIVPTEFELLKEKIRNEIERKLKDKSDD